MSNALHLVSERQCQSNHINIISAGVAASRHCYENTLLHCLGTHHLISGGGGGLEVLLLANFFFTSGGKQVFFLANFRQFFFYVLLTKFFVICFP